MFEIKKDNSDHAWFICQKCDTPMRPVPGKAGVQSCKCGAVRIESDQAGRVMMIEEEKDAGVIDND